MGIGTFFARLIGDYPMTSDSVPLTKKGFSKLFQAHPAFVDHFPIVDYDNETQTFLMDDGVSRGLVYRLTPADTEGSSLESLESTVAKIDNALQQLPRDETAPWVCQIFSEDREPDNIAHAIKNSIAPEIAETKYTKRWTEEQSEHFDMMRSSNGIFKDERVSSSGSDEKGWRAMEKMVHLCFYRKATEKQWSYRNRYTPAEQLNTAIKSFVFSLQNSGVGVTRCDDNDLRNWLLPIFTPSVPGFDTPQDYLRATPIAKDDDKVAGWDLGNQIIHYPPAHFERDEDLDKGVLKLGDTYMRYVTLQGIERAPDFGEFTQDTVVDNKVIACRSDKLPSDTIMAFTIVPRDQLDIDTHLDTIHQSASKSASEWAADAEEQVNEAKAQRRQKSEVFNVQVGYFLRAKSLSELDDKRINAETVMAGTALRPIPPQHDLLADDAVIRNLPFIYDFVFDKKYSLRSRMAYTAHISAILPLYGRGLGGSMGFVMYRRDGQVYTINPFLDRKRVAHKNLFGPSGSGKSATFVCQTAETMAINRPRQIIIEKGNSFDLLMGFYEDHEITVSRKQFTMDNAPSFPPYFDSHNAVKELRGEKIRHDEDADDDQRSYIGEMLNITQLMITGGNELSEKEFDQAKLAYLQTALIRTLNTWAKLDEKPLHIRPSDVVETLRSMSEGEDNEKVKQHIRHMADALSLWEDGVRGAIFNTHGSAFSDKDDVTHIDLGLLTASGNEDMLQVAILAMIYNITALGERHQYSGRHIDVLVDEGHYLAKNKLAAVSFTTGVKVWRKLNTWLTIATQSFDDFTMESRDILNQAEFWILLSMTAGDAAKVANFKDLTEEQRRLILQSEIVSGNYVEGVVLSESFRPALVRFVPPALAFALAQTDGKEKTHRRNLMTKHSITELEAAYEVAEEIKAKRRAYAFRDEE